MDHGRYNSYNYYTSYILHWLIKETNLLIIYLVGLIQGMVLS